MSNPLGGEQARAADMASAPHWPDASNETVDFGLPPAETVATAAPAQPFGLPPPRPGMFGPGAAKFWNRPEMAPYEMKPPSIAMPPNIGTPFGSGAAQPSGDVAGRGRAALAQAARPGAGAGGGD